MKFQLICKPSNHGAHSPFRVVEQDTGREVGWVNRFLDRQFVRRVADTSLRIYGYNLLYFVRWWASGHDTGEIARKDLSESKWRASGEASAPRVIWPSSASCSCTDCARPRSSP